MKKRLLAWGLCLALMLSLLPGMALASSPGPDEENNNTMYVSVNKEGDLDWFFLEGMYRDDSVKIDSYQNFGEISSTNRNLTVGVGSSLPNVRLSFYANTAMSIAANANSLAFVSDLGSVTLDASALQKVGTAAEGLSDNGFISITVQKLSGGDAVAAYTIELTTSDGTVVLPESDKASNGTVTVSLPLPAGITASELQAQYVKEGSGAETLSPAAAQAEGQFAFTTNYLSGETIQVVRGQSVPTYPITIGDMENGTLTANPTSAKEGDTVTLTATPSAGYQLAGLTVTGEGGNPVSLTNTGHGTYTFPMPASAVTALAAFAEIPDQPEQPEQPTEPFTDVRESDWFYDAVVYAYENALMDGMGEGTFAPNATTTRAMVVTILYRLEGEPAVSGDLPFTDVEAGTWYTDAILWAVRNGVVNGMNDTQFAPGNDLTREQLVTILYRYAQDKGYDVSASADLSGYPDAGQVQTYAQPAMAWAVAEGIVEGMDGNLTPAGNASRAQIATILMRFCEDVAK